MQDVARTELTHPVVRLEVPTWSGIRDRVDRETLVVFLVPDDCLDDRRGNVSGILVPLDAFGRRTGDERTNFREHSVGKRELARVRINLVDEPAVVTPTNRHTRNQRSQRIILGSHVSEPIVLPDVSVVLKNVL